MYAKETWMVHEVYRLIKVKSTESVVRTLLLNKQYIS